MHFLVSTVKSRIYCIKMDYNAWNILRYFVFGLLQMLEFIAFALFLISHYVSGPCVRFALLAQLASIKINSNLSQSLRQLCDHILVSVASTVSPCVTYLPLYIIYCVKNDSVQTQWTQSQKRIVGARLKQQL